MGKCDWYIPIPAVSCPVCGQEIQEWLSKEGPCLAAVFRQGSPGAADTQEEERSLSEFEMAEFRLPDSFSIRGVCCDYQYECVCRAEGGIWNSTRLASAIGTTHKTKRKRPASLAHLHAYEMRFGPVKNLPKKMIRRLSRDGHPVPGEPVQYLDEDDIKAILRTTDVPFGVMGLGPAVRWIEGDERVTAWRDEFLPRLVRDPTRGISYADYPGMHCYTAEEWACEGRTVCIVFLMHH